MRGFLEEILAFLTTTGYANLTVGHVIMIAFALALIYLGVAKKYEPLLLVPIGFGCALANVPLGGMSDTHGLLYNIRHFLIDTEVLPILIFIGVGAMTDFGPMLARPLHALLLGAAGQLGIFLVFLACLLIGYTPAEAAGIGIIGSADGPTIIYANTKLAPHLLGPVAASGYLYMAMVPIIQPPLVYALTTAKERAAYMPPMIRKVSKLEKIIFTIVLVVVASMLVPAATPLIGAIAVGNLFRESGVTERLARTSENELMNICTILVGLGVGGTLTAEVFLKPPVLLIFALGVAGFAGGTVGGLLLGKLFYVISKGKYNPVIGVASVSAVPMTARVSQVIVSKANSRCYVLMHAMGPNIAGVIASALVAGYFITLLAP
ncbi:MAG: sodium ion-translocating decarboxylase subunit beta [Candidatus Bathyarchaeia archaeon]